MTKTVLERLSEKYEKSPDNGCWNWCGALSRKASDHPYGHLKVDGKMVYSHRLMFELHTGKSIPEGMQIDHLCRNTKCCNPKHLELVSSRENTIRGANAKQHCINGHDWIAANHFVNDKGHRRCKICANDYLRKWRQSQETLRHA